MDTGIIDKPDFQMVTTAFYSFPFVSSILFMKGKNFLSAYSNFSFFLSHFIISSITRDTLYLLSHVTHLLK